jgi:hypothetical protein
MTDQSSQIPTILKIFYKRSIKSKSNLIPKEISRHYCPVINILAIVAKNKIIILSQRLRLKYTKGLNKKIKLDLERRKWFKSKFSRRKPFIQPK